MSLGKKQVIHVEKDEIRSFPRSYMPPGSLKTKWQNTKFKFVSNF